MLSKFIVRTVLVPLLLVGADLKADDLVKQAQVLDTVSQAVRHGPFRADFASLSQSQVPDWYRDAKFGIFLHWGIYSVPAWDTEWYPHFMYQPGTDEYTHQLATYGKLSAFGYKDFIPMFTGSNFDPDAWVTLFKNSGAKFIVPVSEHHDGFSMWNNPLNSYNSVTMGPHQDVVGTLAAAARKQGLAVGMSNHRSEHWWYYNEGMQDPGSDVQDPAYTDLYGPAMPQTTPADNAFLDNWLARAAATVDAYQPDLFYFDASIGGNNYIPYIESFGAHLYNRGAQANKDVALTIKDGYPGHSALYDVERGTISGINPAVWQEDTSVSYGSWGYITNTVYKDPGLLIRELVDDVSKNGVLLLNLGPKPDGTIPVEQQQILEIIGKWLGVNGEAIYGTRPWDVFGEGPNQFDSGVFSDSTAPLFTGSDIRFTVKGNVLYAVMLDWPGAQAVITSLASTIPVPVSGAIQSVQLLGYDGSLTWQQTSDGLVVNMPPGPPSNGSFAYVLKISGLKLTGISADPNGTLRLSCGQAVLNQSSLVRFQYGLVESCYWNSRTYSASWRAHFRSARTYAVTAYAASAAGPTAFILTSCDGQMRDVPVSRTNDWGQFVNSTAVYLNVPAGDCGFTVQPYGPMNLVHIDFRPVVLPGADGSLHLTPSAATINGSRLQVETAWGPEDLGFWNDGRESASWLVHFAVAGTYAVAGSLSTTVDHGSITIDVGGQPTLGSFVVDVTNTGGWDKVVSFPAGSLVVPQSGDYVVSVRASDIVNWHPVDLFSLDFAPR